MPKGKQIPEGAPIAGGVAAVIVFGLLLLPGLLALLLYLFFTIMGMIKASGLRASSLNLPILFAGICVIVASTLLLILGGIAMLGRSLTPAKRRRDD